MEGTCPTATATWRRVTRAACGKVDDAVRQTTNDRLAYNYNNVDADDDEVQPETGKRRGGQGTNPIMYSRAAGGGAAAAAACGCCLVWQGHTKAEPRQR